MSHTHEFQGQKLVHNHVHGDTPHGYYEHPEDGIPYGTDTSDAPSVQFLATINTPGYSPWDDEPPVFDTAREAWAYLASERERQEDDVTEYPEGSVDEFEYADALMYLKYAATELEFGNPHEDTPLNADGTGTIYGSHPGTDPAHDLGYAYNVTAVGSNGEPL